MPDGFLGEVKAWLALIECVVQDITTQTETLFSRAPKDTRKAFALWVNKHPPDIATYLFEYMDERPLPPLIYDKYDWSSLADENK